MSAYEQRARSEKASIAALPSSALFKLVSPDGDQGYPGNLLLEVLFAASPAVSKLGNNSENRHVGSLYIVYRFKLLYGDKIHVTPVNLTQVTSLSLASIDIQHWGFNLDASLARQGTPTPDIKDHQLFIKLDERGLSTGKLTSIVGTPLEHAHTKLRDKLSSLGAWLPTLDLFEEVLHAPARTNPLVELFSERSGWTLTFDSNQPGVQFYSGRLFDCKGTRKPIHGCSGRDGDGYEPHIFAFLEFHEPLAAWLHPKTAVTGETLLTADELYSNFVRVDVQFKRPRNSEADDI
ncbi:galactose mutarotase-like domain-containing protein [Gautieria morchelliformis]|nr:galactose mutarotase-like domain-containing protein [Gautieria morchelliformis]